MVPGVWGCGTVVRTLVGTRGMGPGGPFSLVLAVFPLVLAVFPLVLAVLPGIPLFLAVLPGIPLFLAVFHCFGCIPLYWPTVPLYWPTVPLYWPGTTTTGPVPPPLARYHPTTGPVPPSQATRAGLSPWRFARSEESWSLRPWVRVVHKTVFHPEST